MNWLKLCTDYNIPFDNKHDKILVNCPLPSHGIKDIDNFMALFSAGNCSCWICGNSNRIEVIEHLLGVDKSEAYNIYKEYSGTKSYYVPKKIDPPLDFSSKVNPPLDFNLKVKVFSKAEQSYLDSRNITKAMVDTFKLLPGGLGGCLPYRIVFPVYHNGIIVSGRGRSIAGQEPKYLAINPDKELISHKHTLYGGWLATGNTVCIVEGEIDVVRGGIGFIGTYGVSVTDRQIIEISKYDNIVICFDDDYAGHKAVDNIGNKIATISNKQVEAIYLHSKYKDIGDMPIELINELRQEIF
jgi:hypothetical protein